MLPPSGSRPDRRRLVGPGLAFLAALGVAVVVFTGSDDPVLVDATEVTDATDAIDATDATTDAAAGERSEDGSQDAGADGPVEAPADAPSAGRMTPLQLPEGSGMTTGEVDAPMVMVAFESFGCLWCGHLHVRTMPSVMSDYVDQGLLRVESRMLPYEPAARPGALIGAAAGLQDRYWELTEHLYPFIAGEGEPPAGRELTDQEMGAYRQRQSEDALLAQVEAVAADIDLDWERFQQDYASEEVAAIVARDAGLGRQLGFTGTPAMIINGVPVGGYRSEEVFRDLLDAILEASVETG